MIRQSSSFTLNWSKSSFHIQSDKIVKSFILLFFLLSLFGKPITTVRASVNTVRFPTMPLMATATITVNDFANYRVFQRGIGGTSKSVTISGSYSDMNWSRVEARVLLHGATDTAVRDWTTINSTPGGGIFSGNLIVSQGGWYNIEVRALDASGSVIGSSRGTNKWGVGMIILVIGQSNMSGRGQLPYTAVNSDLAVNYNNAGTWEHLADPYDDESPASAVDYDNNIADRVDNSPALPFPSSRPLISPSLSCPQPKVGRICMSTDPTTDGLIAIRRIISTPPRSMANQ